MRIQVSLTVEVATTEALAQVERAVLAAGRRAMAAAMRAACRAIEDRITACPHCGGADLRSEGTDTRVLRPPLLEPAPDRGRFRLPPLLQHIRSPRPPRWSPTRRPPFSPPIPVTVR